MKRLISSASLIVVLLLLVSSKTYSQDVAEVEGYLYVGGKAACTITWDPGAQVFKVYWDGGTGYTLLFEKGSYPNGNVEYEEYEQDGNTYTGSFIFKDYHCNTGTYYRKDGKSFSVKR